MHQEFPFHSAHRTVASLFGFLIVFSPLGADWRMTAASAADAQKITYEEHVQPIFRQKCFSCHNPDKKSSGLDLTGFTSLMQGGSSGEVVEAGSAADSYLYMLVTHESEPLMPPESEKLPDELLAVIAKWIDGGALMNAGSKAMTPKKPAFDFALKGAPTGKPEGPAPMPDRQSLEPAVRTSRSTALTALATSPWAPLLAIGGQKQVLLYGSNSLALLGVLPFPEGVPQTLKFSRNGKLLMAGGGRGAAQGKVIVWDVKSGERVFVVGDELDSVLTADISADQTMIALGGPNRVVRIYSTRDGSLLHELRKHTDWVTSVSFSPDGVLLATGDRNGGVFVWEAFTAREYLSLNGHRGSISALTWRTDSNILASASEDGSVRLWEMQNGGNVKNWGAHGGGTTFAEFTRDGRIATTGRDRMAKLWDQNGKQLRAFPALGDIALRVTHCDETDRVIAGDWSGAIRVWNAADGNQLGELTSNPLTLGERLQAATNLLPPRDVEAKKLAAAYEASAAVVAKFTAELAAAHKTVADSTKQLETVTATAKQLTDAIAKLTTDQADITKQVAAVEPLVGPLKDAAEKTQQAVAAAVEDKELAAVAAQVKVQFDAKTAALAASKKSLADNSAALDTAKKQLADAQKQAAESQKALDAGKKQVETVTPQLADATPKAEAAKKASDAAAQLAAAAVADVAKWNDEIEFDKKRKELTALRTSFQQLAGIADGAKAGLDGANAELAKANANMEAARKQSTDAVAAVEQAKQGVAKATEEEVAAGKVTALLEGVLPLLKETVAKAQQAAEKSPGDKEIAASVASLTALVDTKSKSLEESIKVRDAKKVATAKSKEVLAAAEKKVTETAAAVAAAEKVTAERTATTAQAKQAFDAAHAASETARAAVDTAIAALYPAATQQANAEAKK